MINTELSLEGITIILIVTFITTTFLVGARLFLLHGRVRSSRTSYAADAGLYLAYTINVVEMVVCCIDLVNEIRVRREGLPKLVMELKLLTRSFLSTVFSTYLMYLFELWCLKLAYLAYFFNLRAYLSRRNMLLYISTCLYTASGLVVVVVTELTYCHPVTRNWTFNPVDLCIATSSLQVNSILAGINISNDLLILFLGLHIISSLRIGPRQKAALFTTAALGSLSIVAAAVRYFFVYYNLKNPENGFIEQYHAVLGIVCIELTFAFSAFCLPAFRVIRIARRSEPQPINNNSVDNISAGSRSVNERTLVADDSIALYSAQRRSDLSPAAKDFKWRDRDTELENIRSID